MQIDMTMAEDVESYYRYDEESYLSIPLMIIAIFELRTKTPRRPVQLRSTTS